MTQQTLKDKLTRYADLKVAKKTASDYVKEINEGIKTQEAEIIAAITDLAEKSGIEDPSQFTVVVDDRRYGLINKPYYRIRAVDRDIAFKSLRRVGLSDLIVESVSDSDLTKALVEIIAQNNGELPEQYDQIPLECYEKITISDRKVAMR